MKEISREDLQRFPTGVHVVEVIPGEGQCSLYKHFPGVECAQLADLRDFAREHAIYRLEGDFEDWLPEA